MPQFNPYRTQYVGWVPDSSDPGVRAASRRLGLVTGLRVAHSPGSTATESEDFQVGTPCGFEKC